MIAQNRDALVRRLARERARAPHRLADHAGVHEIMVTTMTHDHADRRRSYELLARSLPDLGR